MTDGPYVPVSEAELARLNQVEERHLEAVALLGMLRDEANKAIVCPRDFASSGERQHAMMLAVSSANLFLRNDALIGVGSAMRQSLRVHHDAYHREMCQAGECYLIVDPRTSGTIETIVPARSIRVTDHGVHVMAPDGTRWALADIDTAAYRFWRPDPDFSMLPCPAPTANWEQTEAWLLADLRSIEQGRPPDA